MITVRFINNLGSVYDARLSGSMIKALSMDVSDIQATLAVLNGMQHKIVD